MGDYGPATSPTATTLPDGVPAIPTVTEDISVLVTGFGVRACFSFLYFLR